MTPDILGQARRHWRFALVGVALGAAVGFASTLMTAPLYQAEAVLAPTSSGGQGSGLASLLGPLQGVARMPFSLGDDSSSSERAVAIMRSRAFTEEFVQAQNLVEKLTPQSRLNQWLGRPSPTAEQRVYEAARVFRTSISAVRVDARSGFVTVAIRWSDPVEAAEWANSLVAAANEEARARAITEADSAIQFLQDELQQQSAITIQVAINQLIESQLRNKMLAKTRPQYVYTVLSPALPPPAYAQVSPDRPLITLVTAFMGGIVALLIVLLRGRS